MNYFSNQKTIFNTKIRNGICCAFVTIVFMLLTVCSSFAGDKVGSGTDGNGRVLVNAQSFPYPDKLMHALNKIRAFVFSADAQLPSTFKKEFVAHIDFYKKNYQSHILALPIPVLDLNRLVYDPNRKTFKATTAFTFGERFAPIVFSTHSLETLTIEDLTRDLAHEIAHNTLSTAHISNHPFIYDYANALTNSIFNKLLTTRPMKHGTPTPSKSWLVYLEYELARCELILLYREYSQDARGDHVSCAIFMEVWNPDIPLSQQPKPVAENSL